MLGNVSSLFAITDPFTNKIQEISGTGLTLSLKDETKKIYSALEPTVINKIYSMATGGSPVEGGLLGFKSDETNTIDYTNGFSCITCNFKRSNENMKTAGLVWKEEEYEFGNTMPKGNTQLTLYKGGKKYICKEYCPFTIPEIYVPFTTGFTYDPTNKTDVSELAVYFNGKQYNRV